MNYEDYFDLEDEISDEEIAAVLEAAAEAEREEAEGTLFSLEEVKAEMLEMIRNYSKKTDEV